MSALADMGMGTATMFGAFDPSKPNPRNLGQEVGNYYAQQPAIFNAASQYTPQYASLYNQTNAQSLMGNNGLVNLYSQALPQIQGASNEAMASQYGAQMGLYGQGLQSVNQAARQANPGYWQGLENMRGNVDQQMALGSQLDPNEQRKIMQNYYSQSGSHGLGGSSDAFGAAIASYLGGQQLRQQRLQNQQSVYNQYGSNLPQIQAPTFQPGYGMGATQGLFGQSGAPMGYAQGQIGSPFNSYGQDLYNTNMGADWAYNVYKSQLHQAGANQTAQGGASLLSSGIAMCWVAREVFGEDNPNWVIFRYWMMNMAPFWLRKIYQRHGERFAKWVSNKPRLKSIIRRWMETKIEEVRKPYAVLRWI